MTISAGMLRTWGKVIEMDRVVDINTCVFGREQLYKAGEYSDMYRNQVGFEILSKFDLPEFETELQETLPVFEKHHIGFHGPVFCAEHSAPRGSAAYEETMMHIHKTLPYAKHLKSDYLVMHLNNCIVEPEKKDEMLRNALENYKELQELFGTFDCRIYVENTGTIVQRNMLLDQAEFTDLCRQEKFDVLIDIGHANANGWDLRKLVLDLKDQIRAFHLHNNDGIHDQHRRLYDGTLDFDAFRGLIDKEVPQARRIIEYTRPELEGSTLHEDIKIMLG